MPTYDWRLSRPTSQRDGLRRTGFRLVALALARWSRFVAARARKQRATREPLYEFHAEAGAPEGALYVDGVLVGMVEGVTRL